MCLTIAKRHFKHRWLPLLPKKIAPVILSTHLVVYKVVREPARNSYQSPFVGRPLTLGIPLTYADLRPEKRYKSHKSHFIGYNPMVINEGWHANVHRATAERMAAHLSHPKLSAIRVLVAVIPAGTKVFYGDDDDIVAETMTLFSDNEQAARWIVDHPVRRK